MPTRFYDRFGDEIANELVEWFNSVDTTYRNDLHELNDRNLVRFEAGLDRRLAEVMGRLEDRFERRLAEFETRIVERLGQSEARMQRWMLGFCTTQLFAVVGLMYTVLHGR